MIGFQVSGSYDNFEAFLKKAAKLDVRSVLESAGRDGVRALERATPTDTGLAAHSWTYEVNQEGGMYTVSWLNTDTEGGFEVVIALQYGHGTGTGGYVQGRDFINPAMRPIFDSISQRIEKAVTSA